jgi:hypothetical protein
MGITEVVVTKIMIYIIIIINLLCCCGLWAGDLKPTHPIKSSINQQALDANLDWPRQSLLVPSKSFWLPSSRLQQGALLLYQNPKAPMIVTFKSTALSRGMERLQKEYQKALGEDYPEEFERLMEFLKTTQTQFEQHLESDEAICLIFCQYQNMDTLFVGKSSSSLFHDFNIELPVKYMLSFSFTDAFYTRSLKEILIRIAKMDQPEADSWLKTWSPTKP